MNRCTSCTYFEETLSNYQNQAIIKKNTASFYTCEILNTVDKLSWIRMCVPYLSANVRVKSWWIPAIFYWNSAMLLFTERNWRADLNWDMVSEVLLCLNGHEPVGCWKNNGPYSEPFMPRHRSLRWWGLWSHIFPLARPVCQKTEGISPGKQV